MPSPADALTVNAALQWARQHGVDRLDAQLLLAHVLDRDRVWVMSHAADALDGAAREAVLAALARRADGEPLAYILGHREFHGLRLHVDPAVLIPRPDSETLVDTALACLSGPLASRPRPRITDLGTGSGAIALALKHRCRRAHVVATDISAAALAVARRNAMALRLDIEWRIGCWWAAFPSPASEPLDLVVANPPYVAAHDPHLQALRHEPYGALVPTGDEGRGLSDLHRIIQGAPTHLAPGGWLLLEHGADQAAPVQAELVARGFAGVRTWPDLAGRDRVTGGSFTPGRP